jgi:hypothetical protein
MIFPGTPRRTVTVPVHGNRDLKRGTLRSIIRQAGLSVEEFKTLLGPPPLNERGFLSRLDDITRQVTESHAIKQHGVIPSGARNLSSAPIKDPSLRSG